jgi:hypothetical protein
MRLEAPSLTARTLLAGSALIVGLAACGTTSSLTSDPHAKGNIDLTAYSRLLITDFADEASDKAKAEVRLIVKTKVEAAGKSFPDLIAATVTAGGGFADVSRAEASSAPEASTLVMRGAVTRWDDGDPTLRFLVGFGAGNARFDARIQLVDGGTDAVLGTWIVDKNSWALGGVIAATQTPETFLPGAAKAIGDELSRRKKEGSIPPQKKR